VKQHPLEALLRPPIELWSAVCTLSSAVIALIAPSTLLMTPTVGIGTAVLLIALGGLRSVQALHVLRYQRNMHIQSRYQLKPSAIPVSDTRLFLGQGFQWTQRHTQRLRDTLNPRVQHYLQPGILHRLARTIESRCETVFLLGWLVYLLNRDAWWNPVRPQLDLGGKSYIHAVELNQQSVWMNLSERVGHTLVLGTTRVGKTRLAELLITQDIARGDVVIVIDPKGDADLMKRVIAESTRAGRMDETFIFHLGYPDISCRYNPIGHFSRLTEVATRVTNQLPSEANSAAFKEFAWRFTNLITSALVAMGQRPDYIAITRAITNIEPLLEAYYQHWLPTVAPDDWETAVAEIQSRIRERDLSFAQKGKRHELIALVRYVKEQQFYDPIADGLRSAFEYDKSYFDKIVASLLPLMEKLISGPIAALLSPNYSDTDDHRPVIDWRRIIRRKGIVYVGLDALSDSTVASAVGNSMFADLVSVAGEIYKFGIEPGIPESTKTMPTISLHADEFNELIGDEFIPLLNKAGGSGFQVTAYTQTWHDVEARLGNAAKAGQVSGNFNTLIMLRVKDLTTAEMLTNQVDVCEVNTIMEVSGVTDTADPASSADFTSRNEDRISVTEVPLIQPPTVMALPKGQAFALLNGGRLWKLRIPLPDPSHDPMMPEDLKQVADQMQRRYQTSEHWWA
jgi:conjugative coupling factor TraD (TOL family)